MLTRTQTGMADHPTIMAAERNIISWKKKTYICKTLSMHKMKLTRLDQLFPTFFDQGPHWFHFNLMDHKVNKKSIEKKIFFYIYTKKMFFCSLCVITLIHKKLLQRIKFKCFVSVMRASHSVLFTSAHLTFEIFCGPYFSSGVPLMVLEQLVGNHCSRP